MPDADPSEKDSVRVSVLAGEDVWFLSGPTQNGKSVVHTPIDRIPFVVGRRSGTSLKLDFQTVSGKHAQLEIESGDLVLTDLGSTNGTYLNGDRVEANLPRRVKEEDLIHFAEAPFRVRRQSHTSATAGTIAENVCDQALALVQFDRLMSQRLVKPHFQPIVSLDDESVFGFEILGRGSVFGLESVGAMFKAAEQLNLEIELSQLLRWEGIRVGRDLPDRPILFVNTHPREMEDPQKMIDSLKAVREMTGNTQLVLEIHESSVTNPQQMQNIRNEINALDIKLAYDDFGSGQARLAELVGARPDFVKFDISLVRGLDQAGEQRLGMMKLLVRMVRDMNIMALAEGVETAAEAEVCRETGFDLAQGFFFGRPAPA